MFSRLPQLLFGLSAICALTLALALPMPPAQPWENSAAMRLFALCLASTAVVVTLSTTPRFGRAVAFAVAICALLQLLIIVYAAISLRSAPLVQIGIGILPSLFACLGAVFLFSRSQRGSIGPMRTGEGGIKRD